MTLTAYGRLLRVTRPLRVGLVLVLLSPVWLPLLVASWLQERWPEVER